jgi:hypothetical protein
MPDRIFKAVKIKNRIKNRIIGRQLLIEYTQFPHLKIKGKAHQQGVILLKYVVVEIMKINSKTPLILY